MVDAIDIQQATLTPAAADRPVTATITRLNLTPRGIHIEFTKQSGDDRWPNVVPATWQGAVQYTVWIGARLADGWHLAASLNAWENLDNFGGPVATPEQYPKNLWYLDAALGGHTPAVGEALAFMVTAGGDRGVSAHAVLERSNVVVVPMPGADGASYSFVADGQPAPPPPDLPGPTEPPPPQPPTPPTDLTAVLTALGVALQGVADNQAAIETMNNKRYGLLATLINTKTAPVYVGTVTLPYFGKFTITLTPQ